MLTPDAVCSAAATMGSLNAHPALPVPTQPNDVHTSSPVMLLCAVQPSPRTFWTTSRCCRTTAAALPPSTSSRSTTPPLDPSSGAPGVLATLACGQEAERPLLTRTQPAPDQEAASILIRTQAVGPSWSGSSTANTSLGTPQGATSPVPRVAEPQVSHSCVS
jgi:hypothetical protein